MEILERLDAWFRSEIIYFRKIPFVRHAVHGTLSWESYVAFLREYYHFVRSASPAYSAAVAHVSPEYEKVRSWLFKTAFAQSKNADLILDDLKALGIPRSLIEKTHPAPQTDALIGYNHYFAQYHHPVGILGTPYLMRRLSMGFGLRIAEKLQENLDLGAHQGTSFFLSIGHADEAQPYSVDKMIGEVKDDHVQNEILFNAQTIFTLYKSFFWSLGNPETHSEE